MGTLRPPAALVDLDGTIFTITPNWAPDRNSEWELETMNAGVYRVGANHLRALKEEGLVIVVVTARGQTCRPLTAAKLNNHNLRHLVDHIHHRPKRWEGRPSALYKAWMIDRLGRKFDFRVAMEDENPNIDVMRKAGIQRILDAKRWHDDGILFSGATGK